MRRTLTAIFVSIFNRLQGTSTDAVRILQQSAFLDPESISMRMLQRGAELFSESSYFGQVMGSICKVCEPASELCLEKISLLRSTVRLQKAVQEIERLSLTNLMRNKFIQNLRIHNLVHLLVRTHLVLEPTKVGWLLCGTEFVRFSQQQTSEVEIANGSRAVSA
jgi:hypothetical protein